MSGSGGGGFGGYEPQEDNCESLVIDTQLSSPKEDVVARINEGDRLAVALQTLGGTAVVVVLHEGDIAGGLASPKIQRLRECIEQGVEYTATVISKNDGQVRVRVRAN